MRDKRLGLVRLVLVVALVGAGTLVRAQALTLDNFTVSDPLPGGSIPCTGFPTIHLKGDGDGALSPGERVSLNVTIGNHTGYPICYMRGILSSTNGLALHTNPNCYDGVIGVRFPGDSITPIPNGGTATSGDPFVVDLSQATVCGDHLEFQLSISYTTTVGLCSGNCSPAPGTPGVCNETFTISLPVFSLTNSIQVGADSTLFPTTQSQSKVTAVDNGAEIGLFWERLGSIHFGRMSYDGELRRDPISSGTFTSKRVSALWNPRSRLYEAYFEDWTGSQWLGYPTAGAPQGGTLINSGLIQTSTAAFDPDLGQIGILYDEAGYLYLRSFEATAKTPVGFSPPLGDGDRSFQISGSSCALGYLAPGGETAYGQYIAAWERHDENAPLGSRDSLVVRILRADTLAVVASGSFPMPYYSDTPERTSYNLFPVLAVDTPGRRFAVAWLQEMRSGSSAPYQYRNEVFGFISDEFLHTPYVLPPNPAMPPFPQQLTQSTYPRSAAYPSLVRNGSNYLVSWVEHSPDSASKVSVAKTGRFSLEGGPFGELRDVADASRQLLWVRDLSGIEGFDRTYLFWTDNRDVLPSPDTLHFATIRPLHTELPYNVDPYDDSTVGQTYEYLTHPSLASRAGSFFVTWRHAQYGGDQGTIWGDFYDQNGTSYGAIPISGFTPSAPQGATPVALLHGSSFRVFWRDETMVKMWTEGGMFTTDIAPLTDSGLVSGLCFLDAAAAAGAGAQDLVAYQDRRSPLNPADPIDLFVVAPPYAPAPVNLTNGASQSVRGASVAAHPTDINNPWFVSWTQGNGASGTDLYLARLQQDLSFASTPTLLVSTDDSFPSESSSGERSADMAVNSRRVVVAFAGEDPFGAEQIHLYIMDLSGTLLKTVDLLSSASPVQHVHIVPTPSGFLVSALLVGESVGMGLEYHFVYQRLDEFGEPLLWPVRIASFQMRMPKNLFDYVIDETTLGAAAIYCRDSESGGSIMNLAMLGFDPYLQSCSLYNQAPTVSTTGPYTVEFGATANLFGSAGDDDRGDSLSATGWDLTQASAGNRAIDQIGNSLSLTRSLQSQYGMDAPGQYSIALLAYDSHGLQGPNPPQDTTLTIADTTGPSVTVTSPNGGETLRAGDSVTVTWDGSDNYAMQKWDVSFCTNYTDNAINDETWQPIALALAPAVHSVGWTVPTQLSATCRVRVVGTDAAPVPNTGSDISNGNFYIVQFTTSAIRTLLVTNLTRFEALYPGRSGELNSKLVELAGNTKVSGVVLYLNNVPALTTPYADFVSSPTSVSAANTLADAIRTYLVGQLTTTYTNAKYLVIAGDDRVVPSRRIPDGTLTYPETQYAGQVDCSSTVGSAICSNYYLTDSTYGDLAYETTTAGSLFLALPDLAVGRLVETPDQILATANTFIAQDGQITLNKVEVTGYDFLEDSATAMRDAWLAGGETVDSRIGIGWTAAQLEADLFSSPPHALNNLNDHSDHYTFGTPSGLLPATQMDTHAGRPLEGTLFYNVGCHSGLNVPPSFTNALDLPELMLKKGSVAYIGNTGFGWGLRYGIGYSERLMQLITARLLSQPSSALGDAFVLARQDYFLENHRYDVFDEKSLMESTLYGLPMYQVVVGASFVKPLPVALSASGPDRQTAGGIAGAKSLKTSDGTNTLPPGVTELDLNFDFSAGGVYQKITTPSGSYYTLNGKSGGEIGDSVQPLFTYDSRLSGTLSHGVLFTGGTYVSESPFNPVVGAPASNNPDLGEGPIAPAGGSFIPTVQATHPTLFSLTGGGGPAGTGSDSAAPGTRAAACDLTQMTVYTGYVQGDVESRFTTMEFVLYYSTSSDKTAPAVTDPGPSGDFHDLNGVTCSFSVPTSDASGVYRVLILYDAGLGTWKSLDLAYDAVLSRWTGSLELARSIRYVVYAVDNAGNVGYLKDTGSDLDGGGQPTGSTYQGARVFDATLPAGDTDGDGMPDVWEDAHGLNKLVNDAAADPDYDGFTNIAEYGATTDPQNPDSDGDGDNDGSEAHNGRNPLLGSDGKAVTIFAVKSGSDIVITWPSGTGQNAVIDGPYWIYRSPDPFFDYQELRPTAPMPLPDGVVTWTDTGAAADGQPVYYYAVSNVAAPAPVVDILSPSTGPAAGGTAVNIYGAYFVAPCTVTFGGTPATNVVVVTNTTITCRTPAHAAGAVDVVVTGPSGRTGTKAGGYTYTP